MTAEIFYSSELKVDALVVLSPTEESAAYRLAKQFPLPLITAFDHSSVKGKVLARHLRSQLECGMAGSRFLFIFDSGGLSLAKLNADDFLSIRTDFHGATVRYRREKGGGKSQMIARAVGLGSGEPPSVLDATAGLGRDAFVLASLGCEVSMVERVPEVRALLADGLMQAAEWGKENDPDLIPILDRMRLIESDAMTHMRGLISATIPDVIYLDPMFPPRSKSAQVKKEMRIFHDLVGTDPDADELLPVALDCARKRVVVKRPRRSTTLGARAPSHTHEGKSNRFDVYVTGR